MTPRVLRDLCTSESLDEGELGELRSNADVFEDGLGDIAFVDSVSVALVEAVHKLGGLHLSVAVLVASIPESLDGALEFGDGLLSILAEAEDEGLLFLSELRGIELLIEPLHALSGGHLIGKRFSGVADDRSPLPNGDAVLLEGAIDTRGELQGVDVNVGAEGLHNDLWDDSVILAGLEGPDHLSEGEKAVAVEVDAFVECIAGVILDVFGGVGLLKFAGHGDGSESGGSEGLHF